MVRGALAAAPAHLRRLRWFVVLSTAALAAGAALLFDANLPWAVLALVLGVQCASNLVPVRGARGVAALVALDVICLTVLLRVTGAAGNPFSAFYLFYVALAVLLLRPRDTWALLALTAGGYALLFVGHDPHGHHDMKLHLQGMWLAFALTAAFVVYFLGRVSRDFQRVRTEAARVERLASLATLAAGAAHELSTPLSTIAVLSKELERGLEEGSVHAELSEEVLLMRGQIQRCRSVLEQMTAEAGETLGEAAQEVSVQAVAEGALEALEPRVRLQLADGLGERRARLFPRALGRALRGLVDNALLADPGEVTLAIREEGEALCFEVIDHGAGMPPEVLKRAGEPFFTTRAPGEGTGLGLFVARTLADRLSGRLEVQSVPGEGTRVRMVVPWS